MGIIEHRRSIRTYVDKPVYSKILMQILTAGFMAPSPKDRKPWYYIVIQDPQKKKQLADIMESSIHKSIEEKQERDDIRLALETVSSIRGASVLIIVCYKYGTVTAHDDGIRWPIHATDIETVELQSVGASVQNMLLKADELGVSSLWCGDILYAYHSISDYLSVPYPMVSAICLGYAKETPGPRKTADISGSYIII